MDKTIKRWTEIKGILDKKQDKYLLLGNGFSQCFSERFNYKHLIDYQKLEDPLKALFETLKNTLERKPLVEDVLNELYKISQHEKTLKVFEEISESCLNTIKKAREDRDNKIKELIIKTLKNVHPQKSEFLDDPGIFPKEFFENNDLANYTGGIFTTNYDVMLYWITLTINTKKNDDVFKDFLWHEGCFNPKNAEIFKGRGTGVHYLHGAFHLYQISSRTCKLRRAYIRPIEEIIKDSQGMTCITGGASEQRLEKIQRNVYLNACFEKLKKIKGSLVIYGHSLSKEDDHIIDAIKEAKKEAEKEPRKKDGGLKLYVSVYKKDKDFEKNFNSMKEKLSKIDGYFFDAETHPFYTQTEEYRKNSKRLNALEKKLIKLIK